MNESARFLRDLFGEIDGRAYFYLWRLSDKRSFWYQRLADVSLEETGENDLYVGVGLAQEQGRADTRIKAAKVYGVTALWADVDYADEAHQKTGLAVDQEHALEIITAFPLAPSIVVQSGHGFQCWWLLKEPWLFETASERKEAAEIIQRWSVALKRIASERGALLDSVHDLSRVMRLPGTFNAKNPNDIKLVYMMQVTSDLRYNPEDFQPYLADLEAEADQPEVSLGAIDGDAAPPFDKFNALYVNDPRFRALYEHKQKPANDDSLSGYDLALANAAVKALWSDDEVFALLVAHRRRYGQLTKHREYYERTISKARAGTRIHENGGTPQEEAEEEEEQPPDILADISKILGVQIQGLIEYTGEKPAYRLLVNGGSILLGGASTLVNQTMFRTKMLEATGKLIPPVKGTEWVNFVNNLMRTRERQEQGDDMTEIGNLRELLDFYLRQRRPAEDIEDALLGRLPFVKDGAIYFSMRSFQMWVRRETGERVEGPALIAGLRHMGVTQEVVHYQDNSGQRTSTSARRLPSSLFPAHEYGTG